MKSNGRGKKTTPVAVATLGKIDSSPLDVLRDFVNQIGMGMGELEEEKEAFDAQVQKNLEACKK